MAGTSNWGTLAVRGREPRGKAYDSITTPIVSSATYVFESTAAIARYFEGEVEREENRVAQGVSSLRDSLASGQRNQGQPGAGEDR